MRSYVLFFAVLICFSSCQSKEPPISIEGEWASVDLIPFNQEVMNADDSFGVGLMSAIVGMSSPDVFLFRSDSLFLDGEFTALYKLADDRINISFDEESMSPYVRLSNDSLWLDGFPEESTTMVFKRL